MSTNPPYEPKKRVSDPEVWKVDRAFPRNRVLSDPPKKCKWVTNSISEKCCVNRFLTLGSFLGPSVTYTRPWDSPGILCDRRVGDRRCPGDLHEIPRTQGQRTTSVHKFHAFPGDKPQGYLPPDIPHITCQSPKVRAKRLLACDVLLECR